MKKSDIFKLIIPEEVERKIRFICQQIWKDEWSGTLFYKPEGNFEDGTFAIRCVDIYVMDIGTQAYTEFDMSPDVISYMTENPELLDCQMGLIHSHNQMSTFFSGTDTNTLREEGMDRNHFVSLIVNNEGTYTAAVTRRVKSTKIITDNFTYPTFEDGTINSSKNYVSESEELEWFYLKIEFERSDSFHEELKGRLDEIRRVKEKKAKEVKAFIPQVGGYGNWRGDKLVQDTMFQETKQVGEKTDQFCPSPIGKSNIVKKNDDINELPFNWNHTDSEIEDGIPYGYIRFNKQIIKSLVLQLITGSIILPNESRIDAKKWAQGMVPIFRKRFGVGEAGLKMFKTWANEYTEYLCWFTGDDALTEQGLSDEEVAAICAHDMIEELTKLPMNEYIKIYIDILQSYIW